MTGDERAKTFEAKVASLIAATRHLDVARILTLRQMTIADPETRRWASEHQLGVVFDVILSKALERLGRPRLEEARRHGFADLLPPGRDADLRLLGDIAERLLGPKEASEAENAQASFEALLTRRLMAAPPKVPRVASQAREPPPLFAAQLGADSLKRKGFQPKDALPSPAAPPMDPDKPFVDFPTLFDDTICAHIRRSLGLIVVSPRPPGERLPFLVAPEFAALFQDVVRGFVLPGMRASRHVQTLADNYNWAEVGGAQLIEIIHSGEVNNPILHYWDARWNAMVPQKKGKPAPAANTPWQMFREDATFSNYEPPGEDDIHILRDIIRIDADALARCWREVEQLYQQEFAPTGRQAQAREGAFRDGLLKWTSRLNDHLGEFMAIKSYFLLPQCDLEFLRRLVTNFGRAESERRRNAPFLCRFLERRGG